MDTGRNFLYSAVALQGNFIDTAHLDEVMEACEKWNAEGDPPLADLFIQRGWIQPADKPLLERLVARKLEQNKGDAGATLSALRQDAERSLNFLHRTAARSAFAGTPQATVRPRGAADERYQRDQLHATGGIGRVWLAHDSQLDRQVALKELLPDQSHNTVSRARFLREARITGQLEHPGIVPVYELAHHAGTQEPFYTMRFLKGRTMRDTALAYHQKRTEGQSDSVEFLTLLNAFVVVCKTVAFAHSRGIIHRDLKGQNVMVGDFGEVVVLDWGLAKELDRAETDGASHSAGASSRESANAELTLDGEAVGTPSYMAPEQAAGRRELIDERTDVYGLGATLYQLLTGQAPFSGPTAEEILKKVQTEPPVPPDRHWAEVPPTLQAACLRALAKQPTDRFASASELAQEVEQWQEVQRRKAEEALRISQAMYHSLVENIPIWAWRKDLASRFTFVNSTFARGVGLAPEELIGKTDHDLHFSTALADQIRRDDLHVITTGETLRLTEERSSDEKGPRFVEVIKTPIRDGQGQVVGTQGILWDMSDWKRAEEALRESEGLYHSLVENIPICVWRKDVEGRFTFANNGFLTNFGKTPDELLGKFDYELFPKDLADKYRGDDARVMKTGETLRVIEEQTASEGRRTVEVIKIPIRDSRGEIVGTQGIFWDTTAWERQRRGATS
jgi:PAS domain S-box-containing protein